MRMCAMKACVPFYVHLGRVERQVEILSDSHGDIESIMRAICTYIPTSVPTSTFNRHKHMHVSSLSHKQTYRHTDT